MIVRFMFLILQVEKLRYTEAVWLAQSHTASLPNSQNPDSVLSILQRADVLV